MNAKTNQVVTVNFDASQQFTFSPAGQVLISTELGKVTYILMPRPLTARFRSNPVEWVNNETERIPIDQPNGTLVNRAPGRTSISIDTAKAPDTLVFYLFVETRDGQSFGSDPTIVTMRPGGGPSGRR
jgi:hypothetical protein